ncbi:MAG: VWA domain-containing protein [Candidatus Eisenbacteria bacterium]|nr:VWA domain-containing protein [Candidatus Eisenbacteria bacterium]
MIRFAEPRMFLLLVPVALALWLAARGSLGGRAGAVVSSLGLFHGAHRGARFWLLGALRVLALVALVVALARPQSGHREITVSTEGVDVMLALDTSTSMQAEDIQPGNRLVAARTVARHFVEARPYDRTGLVVFASQAFTQCPLTLDHGVLLRLIDQVSFGMVEDGTAIGVALASAVNRLRLSPAKSKVVVLLTDGRNNMGSIDPLTAARVAETYGVKVYTVGVGVEGMALYPVDDPVFGRRYERIESDVDDVSLRRIAAITGGRYYRATSGKALTAIYDEINRLEKSRIDERVTMEYNDLGSVLCGLALALLGAEQLLRQGAWVKIP